MSKTYSFDLKNTNTITVRHERNTVDTYEVNSNVMKCRITEIDRQVEALNAEKSKIEIELFEVQAMENERNRQLAEIETNRQKADFETGVKDAHSK